MLEYSSSCCLVKVSHRCIRSDGVRLSGRSGAVDGERRPDPGEQRPDLPPAEDSVWTDSLLPHPADLPLHLGEQKDGHHCPGETTPVGL